MLTTDPVSKIITDRFNDAIDNGTAPLHGAAIRDIIEDVPLSLGIETSITQTLFVIPNTPEQITYDLCTYGNIIRMSAGGDDETSMELLDIDASRLIHNCLRTIDQLALNALEGAASEVQSSGDLLSDIVDAEQQLTQWGAPLADGRYVAIVSRSNIHNLMLTEELYEFQEGLEKEGIGLACTDCLGTDTIVAGYGAVQRGFVSISEANNNLKEQDSTGVIVERDGILIIRRDSRLIWNFMGSIAAPVAISGAGRSTEDRSRRAIRISMGNR
jgi:hypothetical protein